ncbi:MAG TPA: DUF6629 family protein [Patescibacteria group bacterium]|nr:DUF6629 family protein [Patescibacteria group bacterium]
MCFSASASFIAGGALGSAGAVSLRKPGTFSRRPIAAVPLFFGIQQLVEGVLWLSLGIPSVHAAATMAFLLFSHVFWPTYLPYAIWKEEKGPRRRDVLAWFVWFGASVSLYLLYYILRGPVSATLMGHGIAYDVPLPNLAVIPGAYVLATCGSCFASSHKFIRVFGMALVASLVIAYAYYQLAFASVWCFFAAILSFIIFVHLRQKPLA